MKRLISLATISFLVLILAVPSYAASSRKGKKTYNKLCRSCHTRGAEAGKLSPSQKTMSQWKRFVKKNKHKADLEILGEMSEKDRKNLLKFLQDYAADADVAETCG